MFQESSGYAKIEYYSSIERNEEADFIMKRQKPTN